MAHRLVTGLLVIGLSGSAPGATIGPLLSAAGANARFPEVTRADVRVEREGARGQAVFLGLGHRLYVEMPNGFRALVKPGRAAVVAGGRVRPAAVGAPLPGTDILLEDLAPFAADALRVPQVSDDGPAGVVVVGAPATPSVYVLLALTIDRGRNALVRTQYYRETIGNLVKIRRDGNFLQLSGHWRPTEVTVEQPRGGATRLGLTWRTAPEVPEAVFTLRGFLQASPVTWP